MSQKKVFVVIVHYKGISDTLACVQSVDANNLKNITLEIVVVDNGSPERLSTVPRTKHKITLLESSVNLGYTGGNNKGIEYALSQEATYVCLLNNDTLVDSSFLEKLIEQVEKSETMGITVPKIYFAKGREYHKDRYAKQDLGKVLWYAGGVFDWKNVTSVHKGLDKVDKGQYEDLSNIEFASGCCMLVKSELFKKVGMFDSSYFLYYEDADFSMKVRNAGYSIVFVPSSIVWHKNAGSSGSGSTLHDYYLTRNRLLFGIKYAPFKTKLFLLKQSVELLSKGSSWQKKAVRDFFLHKFGKGSYE